MPQFFQTDRSGRTVHTDSMRGRLLVALCGLRPTTTQWIRQQWEIGPDQRDCPRCRALRRKGH